MKIKIIDLLNKIANGEEIPKKIKFENDIYIHIDNYCYHCEETNLILSDRIFAEYSKLNDYVEIIEEPKKIEKWGEGALEEMEKCTDYTLEDLQKYIRILAETQNELIDEINNLKGND